MIEFFKKFVNSTIGTSAMKPLDEMIKGVADGQNELKPELDKGKFAGVTYKTYTGVIDDKFPYFTHYRFRSDIRSGVSNDYSFIITNLQCVVVFKLENGEGTLYNLPVSYNRNTDELEIAVPNNSISRLPVSQPQIYYRVTACVERRYRQKS